MITPSINAERQAKLPPISEETSLEEVLTMITADVCELRNLYFEQAKDATDSASAGRQPDYALRVQIRAWEHAQDVHWSWYKEIQNARTTAAEGPTSLGRATVDTGN
ncbi:hypothetical protein [Mycobacterium sp. AZCC_0083]|uniref:hypothetical protein n=1 Tax=Mycobacterium sp. AZCC_0083 TaxID=2735882 RepID=UPI001C85069D|nr:hypothetical protein [Mycobacterium sp. AZCC_0083]